MSQRKAKSVGILGMATWDTVLSAPSIDYSHDAVNLLKSVTVAEGGKGIVVAVAAQRAGARVFPIAMVGRSGKLSRTLGRRFPEALFIPGLDMDHRIWSATSDSGNTVSFAQLGGGRLSSRMESLAAESIAQNIEVLYVSMEDPRLMKVAIRVASRNSIPLVANLCEPLLQHVADLVEPLVATASVIICNRAEAKKALEILGADSWDTVHAPALDGLIITEGRAGGTWRNVRNGASRPFAAVPANSVCEVGAGDTFNGQFLASFFVRGRDYETSCAESAAAAARSVALPASGFVVSQ